MQGFSPDTNRPWEASDGAQTRRAEEGKADTDEPHRTKVDVFLETGLTPEKFIVESIDAHDGRLKQQSLIDITGWSAGAISNLLQEMEGAGVIERIWIGREKIVCLPGEKPDRVAPPETDENRSVRPD